MRSRNFEVPTDIIVWFAMQLDEHELDNKIEGVTEDEEIIVRVEFESDKKNIINQLHEIIDKYIEENDENDDENEEVEEEEN